MGLFKPAWMNKNVEKRMRGVRKLNDQAILTSIAQNDDDYWVRVAAIERLVDQSTLATLAKNDKDMNIRINAAARLTDKTLAHEVYVEYAKALPPNVTGNWYAHEITDQALLADVARNAQSDSVRQIAVSHLTDQAILTDIAQSDSNRTVRLNAIHRLENKTLANQLKEEMLGTFLPGSTCPRCKKTGGLHTKRDENMTFLTCTLCGHSSYST